MADQRLNVVFSADGTQLKKTISELERQLKSFEAGLKNASGVDSFNRINRAIDSTKNKLGILRGAAGAAGGALKSISPGANQATQSMINLGRVVQDAPFGFLGIANNLNPLLESFQRLKQTTGSNKLALQQLGQSLLGPGGIGLAISVVSSLLIVFGDRLFKSSKKVKDAEDSFKSLGDSLKSIQADAGREAASTAGLIAVLKSETETRERKLAAIKELKSIQPEIFNQLQLEGNAVAGLDSAYKKYLESLSLIITVKFKQAQLEKITTEILQKEGLVATETQKKNIEALTKITALTKNQQKLVQSGDRDFLGEKRDKIKAEDAIELNNLYKDQASLISEISEISKGVKVKIPKIDDKDFKNETDEIIARAKLFVKEFGDGFVVPDLEITFFKDKDAVLKDAKKLLDDVAKGNLQVKFPVQAEFEFIDDKGFDFTKEQIADFIKGTRIPVEFNIDPSLSKDSLKLIGEKLDLRKQFEDFGRLDVFGKIDFTNIEEGLANATLKLKEMKETADVFAQSIGQGLGNAFSSVFDAILEGKDVFKALGNAVKALVVDTIKAVVQMLILRAVTKALSGGVGVPLPGGAGFGTASPSDFGLGVGGSRSNSSLTAVVRGTDLAFVLQQGQNTIGRNG